MKVELGQVIAERQLHVSDDPGRAICVRLGLPRPFPNQPFQDYYCPYQIVGVGDEQVRWAAGVDSLAAIEGALLLLPTALSVLRRKHPGLRWEDAPEGNFGFGPTVMSYPDAESREASLRERK